MQAVLLLNASFEPLKVISWQRAVTMFFSGKVEVIEEYDHQIRSVSIVIKAPAVVRLLKLVKIGRRSPPLSRTNILARDQFTCQYCRKELSSKEATLDHIIPRSQGGTTSWENIVCACPDCNRQKGGRTPTQAKMRLIKKPIRPDWLPILNLNFNGNLPTGWYSFLNLYIQQK
ncbi:MAG TPA: HNH endonuclease [Oligoflexia bacterium]|nr:HNH endonuclease [Oligoflexia bacterium]HMP27935.1 HNH endonuclease [Oligoflexia bacterium]